MPSIPQEIEKDILSRLPVKSILRFKSVCKSWYTLICSREFVNEHDRLSLTNKNPRLIIRNTNPRTFKDMFYSIDYASISSASTSSSLLSTTCKCEGAVLMDDPMDGEFVSNPRMHFVGSCNGLLCLSVNENPTLILWNPYTKECKKILLPSYLYKPANKAYGLGYDGNINRFKLVCIAENGVYVYTLGSDLWRRVDTTPYQYFTESGLLLNGVLHWWGTVVTPEFSRAVVAFDISSEKLMNMEFRGEILMIYPYANFDLTVLGDSLCLVCGLRTVRVDVWVMQNYGATKSWTRKFTTTQKTLALYPYCLKFYDWSFETGEILIQIKGGFGLYDWMNDTVRLLNIDGASYRDNPIRSESFVESLVSLSCNRNLCTSIH